VAGLEVAHVASWFPALFPGAVSGGPWFGWWIVKGNLSSSLTLDTLPLLILICCCSVVARHVPETTALIGALIIVAVYILVGGRVYCSWVCPVNMVTDAAQWLRRRFGLGLGARVRRETRYGILAATLVVSLITGVVAWELVNPVSLLHRGLLFGMGLGWSVIAAIFVFDLLVANHGWCGHLCPVGAFYGLLGQVSPLRVVASRRAQCNDCLDCIAVCPEPQVIPRRSRASAGTWDPLSRPASGTAVAASISFKNVFEFNTILSNKLEAAT
jgi:ferredoxin-type protein NapH